MKELSNRRIRVVEARSCGSSGQSKVPILSWESESMRLVHKSSEVTFVHGNVSFMGSSPLPQSTVLIDSPEYLELGHNAGTV